MMYTTWKIRCKDCKEVAGKANMQKCVRRRVLIFFLSSPEATQEATKAVSWTCCEKYEKG